MKILMLIVSIFASFTLAASDSVLEKEIYRERVQSSEKLASELRLNDKNQVYLQVQVKKSRRGTNGCNGHASNWSTNRCRVYKENMIVPELTIDKSNSIILKMDEKNYKCGSVADGAAWQKVELADNCKLISYRENRDSKHGKRRFGVSKVVINK